MPASAQRAVTRTQIAQGLYPFVRVESIKGGETFIEVCEFLVGKGTFPYAAGEVISAVLGAILGEGQEAASKFETVRHGAITYSFDPPRLSTTYSVQFATVNLPPLECPIKVPAEGAIELGWIIGINVAGVFSYVEPVIAANIGPGEPPRVAPAITRQVQFFANLDVPPGVTLQVVAVPFIRFVTANSVILTLKTTSERGANMPPTSCFLSYQQETRGR